MSDSPDLQPYKRELRSTFKSICIVATCTLAMIVNHSNSSAVSVSLPTIGRELNIPQVELKWVVTGYPLTSSCFLLMFGRIADLYGRKKLMCAGLAWLIVFTLGCSFTKDAITLDVLRAFQGIGTAAVIPASVGVLAQAFPPSPARSLAFATYAAGAPLGGATGTFLGGVLTQLAPQTWRATFYLLAGLSALTLIGVLYSVDADVPSTESAEDRKMDWLGVALVTVGLVLVFFVLGEGESAPKAWATPYIIILLIIGITSLGAFATSQRYLDRAQSGSSKLPSFLIAPPLLKPSIWARGNGRVSVIIVIALLNFSGFLGWLYYVQLYYQNFIGYSPLTAAVRLLPMTIVGLLCNVIVAVLVGRVPMIYLITTGTALTSCASLLFAMIDPSAVYWAFGFPAAIVSVAGADFVFASGTLYVAKVSAPNEQSVVGALFQTMTQLGTTLGVTIATVVFNRVLHNESAKIGLHPNGTGSNVPRDIQLYSYHAAHWSTFAIGVLATILGVSFFRGVGIVGEPKGKKLATIETPLHEEVDEKST